MVAFLVGNEIPLKAVVEYIPLQIILRLGITDYTADSVIVFVDPHRVLDAILDV